MSYTIEHYFSNPIIKHDTGILLVKDSQHRFVASNIGFSFFSGYSPEKLIGLSDHDMPWAEQSHIYISHERDILSGQNYSVIEPLPGIQHVNLVTHKSIIYDAAGIPSGTIATAIPINFSLEFSNLSGKSECLSLVDYGYNLTKMQSLVFYYFLKGYTRSFISSKINISTAAYDHHMLKIKQKFSVSSSEQLKDLAYAKGLHNTLPFYIRSH